MNLKKKTLYFILGFCLGGMGIAVINQFSYRSGNYGGEVLFLPCCVLLIWLGYVLHNEIAFLKSIKKGGVKREKKRMD